MGGDRARWEIYLVSEEYGGRWRESGKNFNYFYICFWINAWVETGQDGRFTCFQRNVEDAGGTVGKKFNYFYICICIRRRVDVRFTWCRRNMEDAGGRVGKKFNYFYICFWINGWGQGNMGDLPVSEECRGRWWD